MKLSQVQPFLSELLGIEPKDPSQESILRQENMALRNEIFDLQDTLIALEKEYEEIKEEELWNYPVNVNQQKFKSRF